MNAVPTGYRYDVCLSFAGERRPYVDQVAETLKRQGISVYYDRFERVSLWGENLNVYLDRVFRELSRYCVLFISKEYGRYWTRLELASALSRAIEERKAYILPARFDDTELPGLSPSISCIDLQTWLPEEFASMIAEKLGVASGPPVEAPELPWPDDILGSPVKRSPTDPRELPSDRRTRPVRQPGPAEDFAWDRDEEGHLD